MSIRWNSIFSIKTPQNELKNVENNQKSTEKLEQNSIEATKLNPERSVEGNEGGGDPQAQLDQMDDQLDQSFDQMDSAGGFDAGSGDMMGGGGDGDFDDGGMDSGGPGEGNDKAGVDKIDINRGSALNPFQQINQKMYLTDQLNKLLESINNTINEYNTLFADGSELDQLRELAEIVDDERKAFIMQQNPENMVKLELFTKQYEQIVEVLSQQVTDKAKNDAKNKKQTHDETDKQSK